MESRFPSVSSSLSATSAASAPVALALSLFLAACGQASVSVGEIPSKRAVGTDASMEGFFDRELALALREGTPGAIVTAVRDGKIVLLKGYGYSDLEKLTPVDPERSVFRAGSVSKTFTATALAMKLHEKGIPLDAPADTYLTDVFHEQAHGRILLWHLLTHTAGLDESLTGLGSPLPEKEIHLMDVLHAHFPRQVRRPGFAHVYSNHGMAAAGAIFEKLAGRPFVDAIDEELLAPLGMKSSAFYLREDLVPALSMSYAVRGTDRIPVPNSSIAGPPAGSLYTTAPDMAQFLRLHMSDGTIDGRRIMSAEVMALIHRTHYRAHPSVPGSALAFYERYQGSHRGLEHAGDWEGFASQLIVFPDEKIGYFVSMNGSPSPLFRDGLASHFSSEFLKPSLPGVAPRTSPEADPAGRAVAAEPGELPQAVPSTRADVEKYAGIYRWARFPHSGFFRAVAMAFEGQLVAAEDGTLRVSVGSLPEQILLNAGGGLFFEKDSNLRVFFHEEGGRVTGASAGGVMLPFYFERVGQFERRLVQLGLLAKSVLIFLGILVFRAGMRLGRRWRLISQAAPVAVADSLAPDVLMARRLTLALPILSLLFLVVIMVGSASAGVALVGELPLSLRLILWLPAVIAMFAVGLLLKARKVWSVADRSLRIQMILVVIASLSFLIFVNVWNLTGWQQG